MVSMDRKTSISHSWTQPYLPTSYNPFYERRVDLAHELQRLDDIDRAVQNMLTYPDAEAIINTVMKRGDPK
jgi:hypothetical protein